MPYYDYHCRDCEQKVALFYKSYAAYEVAIPICPQCGGGNLKRRIGRIAIARAEEAHMDALADDALLSGFDENDPQSIGRFMRQMGHQMGEDLGDEFGEVVERLEKGQKPEDIEQAMPSLTQDVEQGD